MLSLRIAYVPPTATDHVTRLGSIHGPWRRESVAGWCVRCAVLPPYPLFNELTLTDLVRRVNPARSTRP